MFFSADSNVGSSSPSPPNSSSFCVAALSSSSSTTTTSTYANSTWGAGSSSQTSSQGCGKVFMDGTDLDDWPSITASPKLSSEGAGEGMQEQDCPGNNNSSASWGERNMQQKGGTAGGEEGNMDNLYPPRSSPLSPSSSPNECAQPSGVWVSSTSPQVEVGQGSAASYNSKVSHLLPGPQESPLGGGSSSSSIVPGANFNPNVNPSAWPALGQSGTSASACSGSSQHSSVTSASSFSASTTVITTQTLSSVNQTGLYQQQHTETAAGAETGDQQQHLGNAEPEPCSGGVAKEVGPNQECRSGEGNSEAGGEGEAIGNASGSSSSSSAASSSWSATPPVASDLGTGASQSDGWGRGSAGAQGQEGVVWRFGSQNDKVGWEGESGGGSTNPVVSQGAWEGGSTEANWGGTAEGASGINLAIGSGGEVDGSSSSSTDSAGGSGSLEDSVSQNLATMTKAWDNQKGIEGGEGTVGEWGGPGGKAGAVGSGGGHSSSSGGGSIAGSGGGHKEPSPRHCSDQSSVAEVALQSMLNRPDLDPRVLSNTGWGQTRIKQNVAWDLDTSKGVANRNERNPSSSSAFSAATINATAARGSRYPSESGSVSNDGSLNSGSATSRDNWDGGPTQATSGPFVPSSTTRKPSSPESNAQGGQGKAAGGWGEIPPEKEGKGWRTDEQQWGGHRGGRKNWQDFEQQGGGWGDGAEEKGTGGWKGSTRGEAGGWGEEWGKRDSASGGGWGDGRSRVGSNSDEGSSWGNLDEGGSQRGGWRGGDVGGAKSHQDWGGAKPNAAQIPNSQAAPTKAQNQQQQQSQGHHPPGGWGGQPSVGGGGQLSKNQNQSLGWTSGPIPQLSGGAGDSLEPSGWEEPSPQSISRKMEIDDGTSAWGDPTRYNNKNVNLWDKNSSIAGPNQSQQGPPPPPPMQQQPPRRQHSINSNPGSGAVGKKRTSADHKAAVCFVFLSQTKCSIP